MPSDLTYCAHPDLTLSFILQNHICSYTYNTVIITLYLSLTWHTQLILDLLEAHQATNVYYNNHLSLELHLTVVQIKSH